MEPLLAPLVLETPFPRGILPYLVGGLLVGLGAAVIYLATGIIAGASTFLESTLSYVSDVERFNRFKYIQSRGWRVVFTLGIVSGAALWGSSSRPTQRSGRLTSSGGGCSAAACSSASAPASGRAVRLATASVASAPSRTRRS